MTTTPTNQAVEAAVQRLMQMIDEHGGHRWATAWDERADKDADAKKHDEAAVNARAEIEAALRAELSRPLEVAAPVGEADMLQVIDERDRYHEVADDLAAQIAAITGQDLGEHSSINDPWRNAMLAVAACESIDRKAAPPSVVQPTLVKVDEDATEVALRRLLCLIFSRGLAYTDDGELSDSQRHPSIDFLRDAPSDIEAKIMQRNADTLTAPVQTVLCEHSGCGSNTQVDSLTVRLNPGDKVVLLKGRMTQGFDRADAAILASEPAKAAGKVE